MSRHTCTECHEPIRNGEAVIRSENFRQVAWCEFCWAVRQATVFQAELVPAQRSPLHTRLIAAQGKVVFTA